MSYNGLPGGQLCGARDRAEVASLEDKKRRVKTTYLLLQSKVKIRCIDFEVYLQLLSSIEICLSIVPYCKIPQTYSHSQFILSIYCFLLIIVVLSAVCLWRSRQWPLLRGTLIDLQVCWRGLHGLQDTWPRGLGCSGWRSVSGGRGHETLSTVTPSHLSPVSRLDFSDCLIDVYIDIKSFIDGWF